MRVLGIDPGTRVAGYGVVELCKTSNKLSAVAAGVWRLSVENNLPERLSQLAREFERAIEVYKPDIVCIELAFVAVNVRSAMMLGHARGVLMERAHSHGIPVVEVSATAVKLAVMGNGRGGKDLVAKALSSLLKVNFEQLPLDASDALGIAYTYAVDPSRAVRKTSKRKSNSGINIEAKASRTKNWAQYFSKTSKASAALMFFFVLPFLQYLQGCNLTFKENKAPPPTPTEGPQNMSSSAQTQSPQLPQSSGSVQTEFPQNQTGSLPAKKPLPGSVNTGQK